MHKLYKKDIYILWELGKNPSPKWANIDFHLSYFQTVSGWRDLTVVRKLNKTKLSPKSLDNRANNLLKAVETRRHLQFQYSI